MSKHLRILWFFIGGILVLTMGVLTAGLFITKHDAQKASELLAATTDLRVGRSSTEDVARILEPYRRYSGGLAFDKPGAMYEAFTFDNRWLAGLHLSSYRQFIVSLHFRNDLLSEKIGVFSVDNHCRVEVSEEQRRQLPKGQDTDLAQEVHFATIPPNYPHPIESARIIDTEAYSEQGKRDDWAFDLGILSRLGDCTDARDLLPDGLK